MIDSPRLSNPLDLSLFHGLHVFQAKNHASSIEKGAGMLLYSLASKLKSQIIGHRPLLVKYIATNKIATQLQLDGEDLFRRLKYCAMCDYSHYLQFYKIPI